MILSVSRRTDIPGYYADWFYHRLKEGFICVRNPMNFQQVSRIKITPELVDCIVFWTKNPAPMLGRLDELKEYPYYFQFTLNSYGKDIEPNVPSKGQELIETFQRLSDKIGPDKVIWRYDPILLNEKYTVEYHTAYFAKVAEKLHGFTKKCTISFIDFYRNTTRHVKELKLEYITNEQKRLLASNLVKIANSYHLAMDTCAEEIELKDLAIEHARCIDDRLIERITGYKIKAEKDKNQRQACGCAASVDIGMYNTCLHGCKYCYANYSMKTVNKNFMLHDKLSPILCGALTEEDKLKNREVKSLKQGQYDLFKK